MKVVPNSIYQSDCLLLLERIEPEQAVLIYIDPPWYTAEEANPDNNFRQYLLFLSQVLQQSRRILSNSGSLFFHSEPRLTSAIRLILDQVFGRYNFRAEFIWPRRSFPRAKSTIEHDVILLYSKSDTYIYNPQFRPLSKDEIRTKYQYSDEGGLYKLEELTLPISRPSQQFEWKSVVPESSRSWRFTKETFERLEKEGKIIYPPDTNFPKLKVYLSETNGIQVGSVWDDISPIVSSHENLKYLTQKPVALLERIVRVGSNPGECVLDPFCGVGTALIAAQVNDRKWIGCDSSPEGFSLTIKRICERFNLQQNIDFSTGNETILKDFPIIHSLYTSVFTGLEDFTGSIGINKVLGERYKIEALLGEGGMGKVWKAVDTELQRLVAIKTIHTPFSAMTKFREKFREEARIIANLSHPHIIKVYDFGEAVDSSNQNVPYMVIQYISGDSLEKRIQESKDGLSLLEVKRILEQVCNALDYAHSEEVLHLDIKPSNILFDENNNVVITDFGVAKTFETITHAKASSQMGTPPYMPPEQFQGKEVRRYTDVYALGMTLYEMLTSKKPDTSWDWKLILDDKDKSSLLPSLQIILEKATDPNPENRYQSAGGLAQVYNATLEN